MDSLWKELENLFSESMRNNQSLRLFMSTFYAIVLASILCIGMAYAEKLSVNEQPSDSQIIGWLTELKPLPKIHYSWPLPHELLANSNDIRLYEYARLTHAISFRVESVSYSEVEVAVQVCDSINKKNPKILCSLAINYSPWHRKFEDNLPPTNFGKSHEAEIEYFSNKLKLFRKFLLKANDTIKSSIMLTAILLDSERFHVVNKSKVKLNTTISRRHGLIINVEKWNNAITQKHDLIYTLSKSIFPTVKIIQYDRGGWMVAATPSGWMQAAWYALDEIGESFSVSLYRVSELETTREAFRRTVTSAKKYGVNEVIPWLALGSGFRRQVDSFRKWSHWNYDLIYSWQIGAELNVKWYGDHPDRFAPWHKAKVIVFFPSPFSKKYPSWAKHFVAYVRGANEVRNLPE